MIPLLLAASAIQLKIIADEHTERAQVIAETEAYARASGKPMLIVGRPKGKHTAGNPELGDVCVDIDPQVLIECPGTGLVADIQQPLPFPDKHFGATSIMHVLEHVDDPFTALAELGSVSDVVFVAYPKRWSALNWIQSDHKWIIDNVDGELWLTPIR